MKGKPIHGCRAGRGFVVALSVLSAIARLHADDLTTLSGQTFHAVRPVRIEPDGVTWEHADGVVKVDFADSPGKVRDAYHYDAAKATAYHDARVQAQRQSAENTRQILQANEDRQRARGQLLARAQQEPATASTHAITLAEPVPGAPTLVYRHGLVDTVQAAARSVGEQMAARKAKEDADSLASEGLLGNPRLWSLLPGVGPGPVPLRVDLPNSVEHNATLHAAPPASSVDDTFFNGIYMTKSYNEDVDRAAAFARGTPLK